MDEYPNSTRARTGTVARPPYAMCGLKSSTEKCQPCANDENMDEYPNSPPRCHFCLSPLSSAKSHKGLTANLERHGLLRTRELIEAWLSVDRADFVPGYPYEDSAMPLGAGSQASAPHVHAASLELVVEGLPPREDGRAPRILDIG